MTQGGAGPRGWVDQRSAIVFSVPPWLEVHQLETMLPSGRLIGDFYEVIIPGHVVIVAQTTEGSVVVVRQYRNAVKAVVLGLPSGRLEPGESIQAAGERELLEETGYKAEHWVPLGTFVMDANAGCGKASVLFAGGARQVELPHADDNEEVAVELLSAERLLDELRDNGIQTASSAMALGLAFALGYLRL